MNPEQAYKDALLKIFQNTDEPRSQKIAENALNANQTVYWHFTPGRGYCGRRWYTHLKPPLIDKIKSSILPTDQSASGRTETQL